MADSALPGWLLCAAERAAEHEDVLGARSAVTTAALLLNLLLQVFTLGLARVHRICLANHLHLRDPLGDLFLLVDALRQALLVLLPVLALRTGREGRQGGARHRA